MSPDGYGGIYFADTVNNYVRRIFANGTIAPACGTRTIAGYAGDGRAATVAGSRVWFPSNVAINDQGGFFVADPTTNTIRQVRSVCMTPIRLCNPRINGYWRPVCRSLQTEF